MISVDTTALTYGAVGVALGVSVSLWNKKREMEERCEFLTDAHEDLRAAFRNVDIIMEDRRTPEVVREVLISLMHAYADNDLGHQFALNFVDQNARNGAEGDRKLNPLAIAMRELGKNGQDLERRVHSTLVSLSMNLTFIQLADHIKVEKVTNEAARDPESIWARLWKLVGFDGGQQPPMTGHKLAKV